MEENLEQGKPENPENNMEESEVVAEISSAQPAAEEMAVPAPVAETVEVQAAAGSQTEAVEVVEEKTEALVEEGQPTEIVPLQAAGEPEVAKKKRPAPIDAERRWYVIQTLTSQEDKAKQALEFTIQTEALQDRVFQVLVPIEETIEIKGGKRIERARKMFPGYVFLDMVLDEETWYFIRQTAGVARFIGTKVKPTPVSDKEMQRVLKQLGKEERLEITFSKNEGVRIISGPFRGYTGTVDEINAEKGKLKVLINIFGRDTPVEVNFEHAQKIV